jgi:hypothetical protein
MVNGKLLMMQRLGMILTVRVYDTAAIGNDIDCTCIRY